MESPFDATSWNGITGAIFAGRGSAEYIWLGAMIGLVIVAIIGGWRHERHAYEAVQKSGK